MKTRSLAGIHGVICIGLLTLASSVPPREPTRECTINPELRAPVGSWVVENLGEPNQIRIEGPQEVPDGSNLVSTLWGVDPCGTEYQQDIWEDEDGRSLHYSGSPER